VEVVLVQQLQADYLLQVQEVKAPQMVVQRQLVRLIPVAVAEVLAVQDRVKQAA
tara:strand:- start:136 stop:297 length:162 start_codon:yes stop_codon:yes gene_type:complete